MEIPLFADEFVRCNSLQGLEPAHKVIGVHKAGQVLAKLGVTVVMETPDGSVLEGPIHVLNLPVHPRILDPGQAMLDAMVLVHLSEDVCRVTIAVCELDTVVGQHRMDVVEHGINQLAQKLHRHRFVGAAMQFGKGGLRRSVDGHAQVKLVFGGMNLGDADKAYRSSSSGSKDAGEKQQ